MKQLIYLFCLLILSISANSKNITHIQIQDAISPATAKYL
jgi:hypothetical protein